MIGRPCTVCQSSNLRDITGALSLGASVSAVSKRYGLSESALFRHQRNHRPEQTRTLTLVDYSEDAIDVVSRVLEVADDARNLRRASMASGNSLAVGRAADSELKALQLLGDRYGVDNQTMLGGFNALLDFAKATLRVARAHPRVAAEIFEEMPEGSDPELLSELRQLMKLTTHESEIEK